MSRVDVGAGLLETSQDGQAGCGERGVELLAGVVIRDSQDSGGPSDRKLLDMHSHWRPQRP